MFFAFIINHLFFPTQMKSLIPPLVLLFASLASGIPRSPFLAPVSVNDRPLGGFGLPKVAKVAGRKVSLRTNEDSIVPHREFISRAALDVPRGGASKPAKKKSSRARPQKKKGARSASLSSTSKKSSSSSSSSSGKGALLSSAKSKSAANDLLAKYSKVLPVTRVVISICTGLTVLSALLGPEMSQALFAFSPAYLMSFQFWRLVTAATYLGPPSISSLMSVYNLYEYGSNLERAFGRSTVSNNAKGGVGWCRV